MSEKNKEHDHLIHYKVDDEPQSTSEKELTPVQIMTSAGIDSQTSYLKQKVGHEFISYQDKPNEIIQMKDGMHFISVFVGPMGVS